MSQIEQETTRFLKRIIWSLSSGLVWLFINFGVGIYNGWMVPRGEIKLANIIFYIWMALSIGLLIWINYKIWKEKFPHG
jgi:FtsH-binding integral membrane protein